MKVSGLVVAAFCLSSIASAQEPPSLTPQTLQAALAAKPEGAEAEKLGGRSVARRGRKPKGTG